MKTRLMLWVLGALIACLLVINGLTIAVLLNQRSEIDALRAQLAASPVPKAPRTQETEPEPVVVAGQPTPDDSALARPFPAQPADTGTELTARQVFLQGSFQKFQSLTFKPATNDETIIQRLKVNEHMVGQFQGRRYTGFRFTVPEWINGDLEWMYFHLTNEANKNRRVRAMWFIAPEHGEMTGFTDYRFSPLNAYPLLKQRFPNSREAYTQTLARGQLQPGQNYMIYFWYLDASAVPDIAVALTLRSERGHREFGALPLR